MLSNKLINKLRRIIKDSLTLPNSQYKHFSFIVDGNKIISFGWNSSLKTHPIAAKFGHRFSSRHSELHAMQNFPYLAEELYNYTFINVRANRYLSEKFCLSKPCGCCAAMLYAFGVRSLYYSTGNGFEFAELSLG